MKCPYCNSEMRKGYVQCRDGVYWTPKKQWIPAVASLATGAIIIAENEKLMPKSFATAYNCDNCKNIIIPYGDR